jgi:hypothetical protein
VEREEIAITSASAVAFGARLLNRYIVVLPALKRADPRIGPALFHCRRASVPGRGDGEGFLDD